jgi:hypothetical protein
MFPQVSGQTAQAPENNLMRWVLLCTSARDHQLVDWKKSWAEPFAGQLRTAAAAHPENRDLLRLDKEVAGDPVSGPIYLGHDLPYAYPGVRSHPMCHPGLGDAMEPADRCCERHTASRLGRVTVCTAHPVGSAAASLSFFVFS